MGNEVHSVQNTGWHGGVWAAKGDPELSRIPAGAPMQTAREAEDVHRTV